MKFQIIIYIVFMYILNKSLKIPSTQYIRSFNEQQLSH